MPPRTEAQRRAMYAAAAGKGRLGIPRRVAREYLAEDAGGKLPEDAEAKARQEGQRRVLRRLRGDRT